MLNSEYFLPIVERISTNKKDAAIVSNYDRRHHTAKYFKSLLYLLSNTSLQEHIGYITYTKEKSSYYPTLRRHFDKSNYNSFNAITQSYQNATAPWSRIARALNHTYANYPSGVIETSFKVLVKNYEPSLVLEYISNPYIVSSIYKAMLNFDPAILQNKFDHSEIAPYLQQSETI